jgi:hypothetical protein
MVRRSDGWIGVAKDGHLYRSVTGTGDFWRQPLLNLRLRHVALRLAGSNLHLFYTRIGDAPERIWQGTVDLNSDTSMWRVTNHRVVLAPEFAWEGADVPVRRSKPGIATGRENALRDPAIFEEDGETYLLYATAGEEGIAIARLN